MSRRRWWLLPVILAAAVLLWVVVRRITTTPAGGGEAPQSVPVLTGRPRIGAVERILSTSGTLTAGATIRITSKVSGRIEAILVKEGQAVADGELLVRIDQEVPRLQVEQAYAAWQAAEAQYQKALKGVRPEELENARALYEKAGKDLATAEEGFKRSQQLYDSGTIPKAQFEQAESTLRAARTEMENAGRSLQLLEQGASAEEKRMAGAQAEAAEAGYRLASLQLDYTRIRAPGAAVVAKVLQDEGNTVGTSTPIMVLVRDDRIQVEIEAPEKYYGEIRGGGESLPARIVPQAYPGSAPFPGRILTVAPTVDPGSRTFTVTVEMEDPLELLRPGMYAEVELVLERVPDALLVPQSALLDRGGQAIVFVVRRAQGGVFAAARTVVPGIRTAGEVQIVSGLGLHEEVIVEGNAFLEEGQQIEILEGR